jgi:DNA-binding transcriptional ArsR family regulator
MAGQLPTRAQEELRKNYCATALVYVTISGMTPRQITDKSVLAALAHPLRRRLIDILRVYGPATASTLAERTGQAIGNVSHHLKVLGASELIEEAPELAKDKRERWWRVLNPSIRWSSRDFENDADGLLVADAAQAVIVDQHIALARAWFATSHEEQGSWSDSAFTADKWMRLTVAELAEVGEEIVAVLTKWGSREVPDDGHEREPVMVFAYGMPAKP